MCDDGVPLLYHDTRSKSCDIRASREIWHEELACAWRRRADATSPDNAPLSIKRLTMSEEAGAKRRRGLADEETLSRHLLASLDALRNDDGLTKKHILSYVNAELRDEGFDEVTQDQMEPIFQGCLAAQNIVKSSKIERRYMLADAPPMDPPRMYGKFTASEDGEFLDFASFEQLLKGRRVRLGEGYTSVAEIMHVPELRRDGAQLQGDESFVVSKQLKLKQGMTWNAVSPYEAFKRETEVLECLLKVRGFPQIIGACFRKRVMYMSFAGESLGKEKKLHFTLPTDLKDQLNERAEALGNKGVFQRDFSGANMCLCSSRALLSLIDFGAAVIKSKHVLFTPMLVNASATSVPEMQNLLQQAAQQKMGEVCKICKAGRKCAQAAQNTVVERARKAAEKAHEQSASAADGLETTAAPFAPGPTLAPAPAPVVPVPTAAATATTTEAQVTEEDAPSAQASASAEAAVPGPEQEELREALATEAALEAQREDRV